MSNWELLKILVSRNDFDGVKDLFLDFGYYEYGPESFLNGKTQWNETIRRNY